MEVGSARATSFAVHNRDHLKAEQGYQGGEQRCIAAVVVRISITQEEDGRVWGKVALGRGGRILVVVESSASA